MKFASENNLHIELDTKHCELSAAEIEKMEKCLSPLRQAVAQFPVSDLYITIIHHPRSKDYHVKTSLLLTGRTLFTGERDIYSYPAFERCITQLVKKLNAYKASLANEPETAKLGKGTYQELMATTPPDGRELEQAVESGDYATFRRATYGYEEPVRKRIGRWIQRFPEANAMIGNRLQLDDFVEEVFLNAFENYNQRPEAVRFGDWLENLIDPSLKVLLQNPDEEMENINFARTLREAEQA